MRGDSEAWRNPRARWAVAALSEEEVGRGGGRGGDVASAASPSPPSSSSPSSVVVTPARATGWASAWASDTFGDPLCGGLVAAAALLPPSSSNSASAAAVAAFDLLEESDALSSLPSWEGAVFAPAASSASSSSSSSPPSFRLPAQLASRAATALAAGRLDRAIGEEEEGSAAGIEGRGGKLKRSCLALSDALAWLQEQCAVVNGGGGSGSGGGGEDAFATAATASATAAAALRHFLAQARPRHVAALVRFSGKEKEGEKRMATLRALRAASGGNEALEKKVKEAEDL